MTSGGGFLARTQAPCRNTHAREQHDGEPLNSQGFCMHGSQTMHIAYVTVDETNRQDVLWMVPEGLTVQPLSADAPLPDRDVEGYVYDLDRFPAPLRKKVLAELYGASPQTPTAVHSLSLEEDEILALRRNGVRVHRRLEPAVFEAFLHGPRRG
jgi:hypothetical protein